MDKVSLAHMSRTLFYIKRKILKVLLLLWPYLYYFEFSGSYDPEDWNLFGRSEDLTNNISEGLNSKIIKLLVSSHPHLNKLLYTLVGIMMEAEQKYLKVLVRLNILFTAKLLEIILILKLFREENHLFRESRPSMNVSRRPGRSSQQIIVRV